MRNFLIFGLMVLAMVLVQFAQGQTVDEVIDKHAEARGGKGKLLEVKSIYMEGAAQMMGNEVTIKITKEQGKLSRTEFEMGAGNGFRLITDKEGWSMFSMRSATPTAMPADAVAAMQTELDIAGPLIDYATKGHKAELTGKEDVNGVSCYKIKLTTNTTKEINYWIDAATWMLVQTSQKGGGRRGGEAEVVITYSDYRAVEGIQVAHVMETKGGGPGGGSTTFDKIEINKAVDSKLYKPE